MALYNPETSELQVPKLPNHKTLKRLQGFYDAIRWERSDTIPRLGHSGVFDQTGPFQAWPTAGQSDPAIKYALTTDPAVIDQYDMGGDSWKRSQFAMGMSRRTLDFSGVVLELPDRLTVHLTALHIDVSMPKHIIDPNTLVNGLPDDAGPYRNIDWEDTIIFADPFNHAVLLTTPREQQPPQ